MLTTLTATIKKMLGKAYVTLPAAAIKQERSDFNLLSTSSMPAKGTKRKPQNDIDLPTPKV